MFKRKVGGRFASSVALPGIVLAFLGSSFATPAEARHHHHGGDHRGGHHAAHHVHVRFHARHGARHVHAAAAAGVGGTASIVVDGASGRMIYGMNEDAPRHPASVTKVMTLYLLFEQLEKGKLSLNDEITISGHAAAQAPSKLGLRPGQSIRVEDAIKAIVTKSANDIAVAVAEVVGGTESEFAEMMTRKAHALGMSHTVYVNASGLPNNEQITTAADLAVLGRDIQARFPRYYRYFSLHEFAWHGQRIHTHNHLMDRVEGMDGIKTGYTVASGFNLLSSVKRDGHYIVSVVLGGKSARARDNYMESLIERHIEEGGARAFARADARDEEEKSDEDGDEDAKKVEKGSKDKDEADKPEAARLDPNKKVTARVAAAAPQALHAEAVAPQLQVAAVIPESRLQPASAYSSAAAKASRENEEALAAQPHRRADGSTTRQARDMARDVTSSTSPAMRWTAGPAAKDLRAAVHFQTVKAEPKVELKAETKARAEARLEPGVSVQARQTAAEKSPVSGWIIQIGATDDAGKAEALLSRAKNQRAALLSAARPFTEQVHKGHETLYRARFAGLEESKAEAACKALKTSGFSCFAMRN
jgi:D-alanyl-D-alanine carboxypeptidase